jgi:hypothetical protein
MTLEAVITAYWAGVILTAINSMRSPFGVFLRRAYLWPLYWCVVLIEFAQEVRRAWK